VIALVVSVPLDDVELESDVLWGLGVVAIEERAGDDPRRIELWTSLGDDLDVDRDAPALAAWPSRLVEVDESVADTWRAHALPIEIDTDLVICPAWVDPGERAEGMTVVFIEPSSTFGLGDHPTTRLTLRAMRRVLRQGHSVLDVGCGSGVLTITAVLSGAASAHGIDISPAAVPTTMANAQRNGVVDRVTVATTPLAEVDGTADVVLANILAPELVAMAADLRRVVAPGGVLIVSGILADRHDHVLAALAPLEVERIDALDGWVAITLR
jgi:ribosomal protein L11 methyltransferase